MSTNHDIFSAADPRINRSPLSFSRSPCQFSPKELEELLKSTNSAAGRRSMRTNRFRNEIIGRPGRNSQPNSQQPKALSPIGNDDASAFNVEPKSSSSHSNEPETVERTPRGLNHPIRPSCSKLKRKFSEEFYQGIVDFLDKEGLEPINPSDQMHHFSFSKHSDEGGCGKEALAGRYKSATQSPILISEHINTSSLFQRRASRSQDPNKGLKIASLSKTTPPSLQPAARHFQEDVDNLLQSYSPILEDYKLELSRQSSEAVDNDCVSGKLSIKRSCGNCHLSPELGSHEIFEPRGGLRRHTINPLLSSARKIERTDSFNFLPSPIPTPVSNKRICSLNSSPAIEDVKLSLKQTEEQNSNSAAQKSEYRKSQFQRLRSLQV